MTLQVLEAASLSQAHDKVEGTPITGDEETGYTKDVKWASNGQRLLWQSAMEAWSADGSTDEEEDDE